MGLQVCKRLALFREAFHYLSAEASFVVFSNTMKKTERRSRVIKRKEAQCLCPDYPRERRCEDGNQGSKESLKTQPQTPVLDLTKIQVHTTKAEKGKVDVSKTTGSLKADLIADTGIYCELL